MSAIIEQVHARLLAARLIETLPSGLPGLFNPWEDHCPFDTMVDAPSARFERLAQHLDCDPVLILVGEAIGYQGGRYSGIAFTNERLLTNGTIPRVPALPCRLSLRNRPFSEPSATIVWEMLYALGIAERTILWNALQLHPYIIDNPWSNRTPTTGELAYGAEALRRLVAAFPVAQVIAVGKKAEYQLLTFGINSLAAVRHPAYGGAKAFRNELKKVMG